MIKKNKDNQWMFIFIEKGTEIEFEVLEKWLKRSCIGNTYTLKSLPNVRGHGRGTIRIFLTKNNQARLRTNKTHIEIMEEVKRMFEIMKEFKYEII